MLLWPTDDGGDRTSRGAPSPTTTAQAPPSQPSEPPVVSEEKFCEEFRRLAAAQGEYAAVPDQTATELLREAADRMVAVGVPRSMTLPARGGYHGVLEGIYGTLGLTLDRAAVGALDEPAAGEDAAFGSYLTQFCPA